MNHGQRMDLFDREQNLSLLERAVVLAEAGNLHGVRLMWRAFGQEERRRLQDKSGAMARWPPDENYAIQSAELHVTETALLERMRIACEQNAEVTS